MPRYIRAGKYNEEHETELPVIIGGGTSRGNRKDIMTMDWDGNAMFAGGIETAGGSLDENGNLSIDGNAEITGSVDIGDDVEISGDLDIVDGFLTVKSAAAGRSRASLSNETLSVHRIENDVFVGEKVFFGQYSEHELFMPYMNTFRLFLTLNPNATPSLNKTLNFSILSKTEYSGGSDNLQLVTALHAFLSNLGCVSDVHMNTPPIDWDKIFTVDGIFIDRPILGMYVYTTSESDNPRYKIDIICWDTSETYDYKVYTWVSSLPISVTPPAGETWVVLEHGLVNSYCIENASFE